MTNSSCLINVHKRIRDKKGKMQRFQRAPTKILIPNTSVQCVQNTRRLVVIAFSIPSSDRPLSAVIPFRSHHLKYSKNPGKVSDGSDIPLQNPIRTKISKRYILQNICKKRLISARTRNAAPQVCLWKNSHMRFLLEAIKFRQPKTKNKKIYEHCLHQS